MERLVDAMARELGLCRAEVRRRNLVAADKMPYARPLKTRGQHPGRARQRDYPLCQQKALDGAGWADFPPASRPPARPGVISASASPIMSRAPAAAPTSR